jgi:hypothetical protein
MKVSQSAERIMLAPFDQVSISPVGSLALVSGNCHFLNIEENGDMIPLRLGQCLNFNAMSLRVCNPYSFPVTAYIARDLPENTSFSLLDELQSAGQIKSRVGFAYLTGVAGGVGKKRGIGFLAKRGQYQITATGGSWQNADGVQILAFPDASPAFMAAKPAGFMTDLPSVVRLDGTLNDQVICIAGYYLESDIAVWKANAGYTRTETRSDFPLNNASSWAHFSETTAVFITGLETNPFRGNLTLLELGGTNELRF